MKTILTLDWDFVQSVVGGAKAECLMPDGPNEKFPYSVHDIVWLSVYGGFMRANLDYEKHIICEPGYTQFLSLLSLMDLKDKTIYYGLSHFFAYGWVQSIVTEPYTLINIDFHSDMRPTGDIIDCGNWVKSLAQCTMLEEYIWVRHPQSSLLDFEKHTTGYPYFDTMSMTFDDYMKTMFEPFKNIDHVFICKSPAWAAPHLDGHFIKLLETYGEMYDMKCIDPNKDVNKETHRNRMAEYVSNGTLEQVYETHRKIIEGRYN
jgi:hypothetical protein